MAQHTDNSTVILFVVARWQHSPLDKCRSRCLLRGRPFRLWE